MQAMDACVIVYWRPMCGYCEVLKSGLAGRGVAFTDVDIWQDRDKADIVRAATGGDEIVPTVQVGERFYVNRGGGHRRRGGGVARRGTRRRRAARRGPRP